MGATAPPNLLKNGISNVQESTMYSPSIFLEGRILSMEKFLLNLAEKIFLLASIMVVAGSFNRLGVMADTHGIIQRFVPSKRGTLSILSLIFGVLPISGRISFTCGVLDALQDRTKNNQKMGLIAYLATHHYYLWSPIEKSVIITCAVAGITYATFMSYMIIPAVIAFLFSFVYIFSSVTEDEIVFAESSASGTAWYYALALLGAIALIIALPSKFGMLVMPFFAAYMIWKVGFDKKWMDWGTLGLVAGAITLGQFVGLAEPFAKTHIAGFNSIYYALPGAFIFAYVMGSSAKFAALCGLLVKTFGIKYLPLFYLVEYSGYLLSPTHACVPIAKSYFKTPIGMFALPLFMLSAILIAVATYFL